MVHGAHVFKLFRTFVARASACAHAFVVFVVLLLIRGVFVWPCAKMSHTCKWVTMHHPMNWGANEFMHVFAGRCDLDGYDAFVWKVVNGV